MAKFDVYDLTATKVGDIELADSVFNIEVNNQAIFDAVLRQRASWRQGTHDTKSRAEVSGGGKKPYKQKGTGHARQGSTRATQFRGGGIAFGPTPRSYGFKLNRKVRRLALRGAISLKAQSENLVVLDSMEMAEIKTKEFVKVLDAVKAGGKVLFVATEEDDATILSARNLQYVKIVYPQGINVYDIVNVDTLLVSEAALKTIEEVFA